VSSRETTRNTQTRHHRSWAVDRAAHSPDDEHGDISIELTEGTFLTSFDTPDFAASVIAVAAIWHLLNEDPGDETLAAAFVVACGLPLI